MAAMSGRRRVLVAAMSATLATSGVAVPAAAAATAQGNHGAAITQDISGVYSQGYDDGDYTDGLGDWQ
ncbi:hypothetical protein I6A84_36250 [Frankia sp. CNm7]|uniref:Uncharacterized protein n=1 Tax=Frankia nepalensis TaxID=1836974 RepID=A0A937RRP0_9ACTN|nr:hypothetical protein [Frankia nepalensis]MBL7500497.1 hypothetical protein [Frankia nepalensis]MBL7511224.1 hypothetical protein [Frankia nepalensis]MBL7523366.1 hypothetical protein [Frankia nepalensis]MBL7631478.1 hypothetical protein [Frankia nepalensis]